MDGIEATKVNELGRDVQKRMIYEINKKRSGEVKQKETTKKRLNGMVKGQEEIRQ